MEDTAGQVAPGVSWPLLTSKKLREEMASETEQNDLQIVKESRGIPLENLGCQGHYFLTVLSGHTVESWPLGHLTLL
jgi:hypothetical protein